MKQGQCLMWSKRKYSMSSSFDSPTNYPSSYDENSWEEQAFAKDAAWSGCIWPPRSYSCSFCRREFRSAQALGGHMNVHRRDRARLKQPYSPQNNETLSDDLEKTQPQNQVQISFTSLGYLYPSSHCGLIHNTNPNSDPYSHHVPASPSNKVLATSVNKSCREKPQNIQLYNNSSSFKGSHESSLVLPSKSWSDLTEDFRFCSSRLDPDVDVEKKLKGDIGKSNADVTMSLNLFMTEIHPSMQFETKDKDTSFKKRKAEASSIPIFTKSYSVDRHHVKSQVFEFNPSSIGELDLELRLGLRPKV